MEMPTAIKSFQALMYISIAIGVILRLIGGDIDSAIMFLALLINCVIVIAITVGIANYRINWIRWGFAILFGVQFLISIVTITELLGSVIGVVALSPMLLRAIALGCLLTPEANEWFRTPARTPA